MSQQRFGVLTHRRPVGTPARGQSATSWRRCEIATFLVALLFALLIQGMSAQSLGGWSGLLAVGEDDPSRSFIAEELGEPPVWRGGGHDGKHAYMIARDPFARSRVLPELMDDPAYRYRRYLYPLLAGGFGTAPPAVALAGLTLLNAIGVALAAWAALRLTRSFNGRRYAGVAAIANPGLVLGLTISTPDALAAGLALAATAVAVRRPSWPGAVLFAAAAATKETYLLAAIGMGVYLLAARDVRGSIRVVAPATGTVLALFAAARIRFGTGEVDGIALDWPFAGLVRAAVDSWFTGDLLLGLVGGVFILATPVVLWVVRDRLLLCLAAPWMLLAVVSSHVVWQGDASRAFAPLWILAAVGVCARRSGSLGRAGVTDLPAAGGAREPAGQFV